MLGVLVVVLRPDHIDAPDCFASLDQHHVEVAIGPVPPRSIEIGGNELKLAFYHFSTELQHTSADRCRLAISASLLTANVYAMFRH